MHVEFEAYKMRHWNEWKNKQKKKEKKREEENNNDNIINSPRRIATYQIRISTPVGKFYLFVFFFHQLVLGLHFGDNQVVCQMQVGVSLSLWVLLE